MAGCRKSYMLSAGVLCLYYIFKAMHPTCGSGFSQRGERMPVPSEYQRATDDFYKLLTDIRDSAGLTTTNQAYTVLQGVFQVFRRRLDLKDAVRFVSVLPVGARALFVADWGADEPRCDFEDRSLMSKEVQGLRAEHNYAPETAIHDVAVALRRNVDQTAFERMLATLPRAAMEFWQA
jgi:uncharacterized protein (DUF2267 family)